jgi:hypothetical protein
MIAVKQKVFIDECKIPSKIKFNIVILFSNKISQGLQIEKLLFARPANCAQYIDIKKAGSMNELPAFI